MAGGGRPRKKGRARKGTGHIREIRPGYFAGEIKLGKRAGKVVRRTVTGRSIEEVEEKLAAIRRADRSGQSTAPDQTTVDDHVRDWLREKKRSVRSGTYNKYRHHCEGYICKYFEGKKLRSLSHIDINLFYEWLDEHELSQRYKFDISCTLRAALDAALQPRGPLAANPAKLAASLNPGKNEARYMTQEEVAEFLRAGKGERLEHMFRLMLNTGLRPGEALGLSWQDVDLENRRLHVRQSLHEEDGRVFIGEVKTKASRRAIHLSDDAVSALRQQRNRCREMRLAAGDRWYPPKVERPFSSGLVFPNENGGLLYRTHVGQRDLRRITKRMTVMRIAAKLGYSEDLLYAAHYPLTFRRPLEEGESIRLPGGGLYVVERDDLIETVTLHTFRHTFAAMLIFEGIDIKVISETLGHESVRFTYDTYGHLLPGSTERAAEAIGRVITSLEQ